MRSEKYDNVYLDEKTSKWMFRIWLDGKQHKKRGFDSDSKANKAKIEFVRTYNTTKKIVRQSVLFSIVANDYSIKKEQSIGESSLLELDNMLNIHILPFFGHKDIFKISVKDIEDWKMIKLKETYYNRSKQMDVPYSISYLQGIFNTLNNVFKRGMVLYKLPNNPCLQAGNFERNKNVAKKSALSRDDFWTLKEFAHFLSYVDDEMYNALFLLLGSTGLRIHELLALSVDRLNIETGELLIDKNITRGRNGGRHEGTTKEGREKSFKLPNITFTKLVKIIEGKQPTDRIFPISYSSVHREYKKTIELSGSKHIKPHGFRHTFITAQLELGTNKMTIAKMVGHSTTEQLDRTYGHLYEQNIIDAANAMDYELSNQIGPKQAQIYSDNKKAPKIGTSINLVPKGGLEPPRFPVRF